MANHLENPVLRGFNPDPSILRVANDYYIATSTFEWFPGVQIHHSRDLVHWELIAHPLDRRELLDMEGNPASGGVWAPCLSHDGELFHLVYSDVKTLDTPAKDLRNYLVTAKGILGPWSERISLNSTGFDPSLFHDDDGRKWLVSMVTDHRKGKSRFGGILLQEYSPGEKKLLGPITKISKGTAIGLTEGPHLYKRNGWYYLLLAEGGTSLNHAAALLRSKSISGPYEEDPRNPILSSRYDPTLPLQKAGHASLVETQAGEWYMAHLCGRPIPTRGMCTLGRETAIQKLKWTRDGWLELEGGGNTPRLSVPAPDLPAFLPKRPPARDDFDATALGIDFQSLRIPMDESLLSLSERPGFLRLKGAESLSSRFRQSLVARRWQSFRFTAAACLEFSPESYKQMAGLVCLYDQQNFFYLRVSHDEDYGGACLGIMTCDLGAFGYPLEEEARVEGWGRIYLRVKVDYDRLRFSYSGDGIGWTEIGPILDAYKLSDEYCREGRFTGAFVGLCCQDLAGGGKHADFDWFEYLEGESDQAGDQG